jgi:hypothetical protein
MKKVICFSVFMVITMIMTVSCTKCSDDPTYPTQVTSIMDLNGSWEFVNLNVTGTNFTTCEQMAANPLTLNKPYLMSFDVNSVTGSSKLKDKCIDPVGKIYTIKQTYNIPGTFTFGFFDSANIPIQVFAYTSYDAGTGTLVLSFSIVNTTSVVYLTVKKI